jgi:hypothetical protein
MRLKRLRRGDPPPTWAWILERLEPGHPERQRATFWARQALYRHWPISPEQAQAAVGHLVAVAHDPSVSHTTRIEAARALIEGDCQAAGD